MKTYVINGSEDNTRLALAIKAMTERHQAKMCPGCGDMTPAGELADNDGVCDACKLATMLDVWE